MVLGPQETSLIKLKLVTSKAIFTYVELIFETCSYLHETSSNCETKTSKYELTRIKKYLCGLVHAQTKVL
jgi:hypothetical protein